MTMTDAGDIIGRSLPAIVDKALRWQNLPCKVKSMQYDMSEIMEQCIESYFILAVKPATCLKMLSTRSSTRAPRGVHQKDHLPGLWLPFPSRYS